MSKWLAFDGCLLRRKSPTRASAKIYIVYLECGVGVNGFGDSFSWCSWKHSIWRFVSIGLHSSHCGPVMAICRSTGVMIDLSRDSSNCIPLRLTCCVFLPFKARVHNVKHVNNAYNGRHVTRVQESSQRGAACVQYLLSSPKLGDD